MNDRKFILCAFLVCSTFGWSQKPANFPTAEIFGGFAATAGGALGAARDWNAGADFRLFHPLFLVGDVAVLSNNRSVSGNNSETLVLVGPRYRVPLAKGSRFAVFGEGLFGAEIFRNGGQPYTWEFNNDSNLAYAVDGGADIGLSRHLAVRGVAGYLYNRFTNSTYGGPVSPARAGNNRLRITADLVVRF
jgi:opacity protein-like surface antigen